MGLWSKLKGLGRAIGRGVSAARDRGLTDEIVTVAERLAGRAEGDPSERREWVVRTLLATFPRVPESVARLAVELAVQAVKRRQAQKGDA